MRCPRLEPARIAIAEQANRHPPPRVATMCPAEVPKTHAVENWASAHWLKTEH